MNQLLEKAVEAVRQMPPDDQEKIARLMLSLADATSRRNRPIRRTFPIFWKV
jgi:hypothetical protein